MILRDWLTFRFATPVKIELQTSAEVFMDELATLTAPRFSTAKAERKKPIRGKLWQDSGVLRWALNEYRIVSPRSLHFKINRINPAAVLEGEFLVWLPFRAIVTSWLTLGSAMWLYWIVRGIISYKAGWPLIREGLFSVFIGVAMGYAYTGICIAVGRRRERDLVRVLESIAKGPEAAHVVRTLLTR